MDDTYHLQFLEIAEPSLHHGRIASCPTTPAQIWRAVFSHCALQEVAVRQATAPPTVIWWLLTPKGSVLHLRSRVVYPNRIRVRMIATRLHTRSTISISVKLNLSSASPTARIWVVKTRPPVDAVPRNPKGRDLGTSSLR